MFRRAAPTPPAAYTRPSMTAAASAPRAVGSAARVAPAVGARIVLEHRVEHGPLAAGIAADDVEPAADGDGRRVMERNWHRRAPLPAIDLRIVGLDLVTALAEAADHVETPAELRAGDLRAVPGELRRARPGPGALGPARP